ncbi:MAG: DNA/RNA nuclease SfsA [Ruminococcus sp.]|nr:DNA/RNA nuclease SfsA [Ruminococcus sp.]
MEYNNVIMGRFLSRPNRFIAEVEISGRTETVHVKNTGRCKELLVPGCRVYLETSSNPARKTKFDLIAAEKDTPQGTLLINMDSQAPNKAAEEWLQRGAVFGKDAIIRREVTYGSSRFDLCIEENGQTSYMEVKGVTLEKDRRVYFPDAPTERGVKHVSELIRAKKNGLGAYILFVVQMSGALSFSPNDETHPQFGQALRLAQQNGVQIIAAQCRITPNSMEITGQIPVIL